MGKITIGMADDLVERCANLNITEEEDKIVTLIGEEDDNYEKDLSLAIVGKVLTDVPTL